VDEGIVFQPVKDYRLDTYVDADFCGLHGREPESNPVSARSRTGYIIHFGGCPLVWKSQLQTETALSTFHAEYVALATALRTVIWLQRVIDELLAAVELEGAPPVIHAEVFEDNNSTYLLANNQQLSPRSRHLNVKWHFFWEHVSNGGIKVSKIDTKSQRADYLAKGLAREVFEHIRSLNQGW
jgi:hypothetical protein